MLLDPSHVISESLILTSFVDLKRKKMSVKRCINHNFFKNKIHTHTHTHTHTPNY